MNAKALPQPGYLLPARILHWTIAVMVLGLIAAGFTMGSLPPGPTQDLIFNLHKSTGFLILVLMVIRLGYRLTHPVPPLPADMPAIQRLAAHGTHWALYALLFIQPIVGWVANSAYPAPVRVFWLFTLPPIWKEDRALSEKLFALHGTIGLLIAAIAAIHIAAALYHHFVRRDNILLRMVRG